MSVYQNQMWDLQKRIYSCPGLLNFTNCAGSCRNSVNPAVINKNLGPDSVFVGSEYGKLKNIPRILFIGKNPNSLEKDFGTHRSVIKTYRKNIKKIHVRKFYNDYYKGTKKFYGIRDFDVFNHSIAGDVSWGIKPILTRLYPKEPKILRSFALTNTILCKGSKDAGNPDDNMTTNCILKYQWLRKTLEILKPQIVFIFSIGQKDSAWENFSVENGVFERFHHLDPMVEYAIECDLKTRDDTNTRDDTITFLTVGIPHLSQPHFAQWNRADRIPILFRELFNGENVEALNVQKIINIIFENLQRLVLNYQN